MSSFSMGSGGSRVTWASQFVLSSLRLAILDAIG